MKVVKDFQICSSRDPDHLAEQVRTLLAAMSESHKPERELITGMSGSGKTTLYVKRLRSSAARWKFVFDFEGLMAKRLGCLPATTLDEMNRQLLADSGGYSLCIYDPRLMFEDDVDGFDFFCDWCFELSTKLKGKKLFACDELQDVAGIDVCPKCPKYLKLILTRGRHWQLDSLCVAQAPNEIHARCRNPFYRVTSFMHSDDNAIKFLKEAGHNADAIRALRPGQFISRNKKTGETVRGEVFKAEGVSVKKQPTALPDSHTPP